jgi:hypothetical protein
MNTHTSPLDLVREHVNDEHTVTRLGCPVCADLPRQRREIPEWRRRSMEGRDPFSAVTDTTGLVTL